MVWVNADGRLTGPPLRSSQVVSREVLAAILARTAFGLILLMAGAGALARRMLDWRRRAAWETEWRAVGPQWTRRR